MHAGWSPVCSSIFQVLLKSVQWFFRCGWSKIIFSHYFGHWLIQQLVLPYKPWCHKICLLKPGTHWRQTWIQHGRLCWKSTVAEANRQQSRLLLYTFNFVADTVDFVNSDKGGGKCVCPHLSDCLSVCLLARLFKNACMDLDECCVSTDVSTWANWLIFEPDSDYSSPDARTGLLSLLSYKPCYAEFYVGKIRRICIGRCSEAWFSNRFTAHRCTDAWFYNGLIHWCSEPSKHLCRRYMRSTECPSCCQCVPSDTVDFVDFEHSRPCWIQLCRQYVPGFSYYFLLYRKTAHSLSKVV